MMLYFLLPSASPDQAGGKAPQGPRVRPSHGLKVARQPPFYRHCMVTISIFAYQNDERPALRGPLDTQDRTRQPPIFGLFRRSADGNGKQICVP